MIVCLDSYRPHAVPFSKKCARAIRENVEFKEFTKYCALSMGNFKSRMVLKLEAGVKKRGPRN